MAVLAVAAAALVLPAGDSGRGPDGETWRVHVGERPVRAVLAASEQAKRRGLAGRTIGAGEGMLFRYGAAGPRSFWMRGVDYPVDIIWVRAGRVTGVTRALPVSRAGLRLYDSPGPADRVLEVPGGWSAPRGIGRGDEFTERPPSSG